MRNLDREGPYTLFVTLVGIDKAFYLPRNTGMDDAKETRHLATISARPYTTARP
jgi:hypothetical protein